MRGKILQPVRTSPNCADNDEIAEDGSHQRRLPLAARLATQRFNYDCADRKQQRRAHARANQRFYELIQPAKKAGFQTLESLDKHKRFPDYSVSPVTS